MQKAGALISGMAFSFICPRIAIVLQNLWIICLPKSHIQLWPQLDDSCRWQVVLNKYETLGVGSEKFFLQQPIANIDKFFNKLVDSPIDHKENYVGFPYYMKINFTCPGKTPEAFVRGGYLKGLIPIVLVTFYAPVNFRKWKSERLQIQMEGAPFQSQACVMNWYTPMPMKNGSVMMEVEISSNRMGEIIGNGRFMININGFLKKEKDKVIFSLGHEVRPIIHRDFIDAPSRPVWATVGQAPVLILGGIPHEKMILISDSSFKDFSLVELNIDSCWLGSLHCPQEEFTASIFDAISTESVLFIRQNQLVYYFTGNYFHVAGKGPSTSNWVRVLHSRCIKKLCPVELHSNGSEYVLALAGGNEEGFFHFGTITGNRSRFQILQYSPILKGVHLDSLNLLFQIPPFIPIGDDMDFVMLLGMEKYTDYPLVPKGLFYNPFSHLLFIWGNAILQSYDKKNYIYMSKFPKESSVKYMTSSYKGQVVCVTENEEIWLIVEGSFKVHRLYPSDGWQVVFNLSQMKGSSLYTANETSVRLATKEKIYPQRLVYLINQKGEGKLLKRQLPVDQILVYQLLGTLSFINPCPFELMQIKDLPNPQRYTRLERYRAKPPFISSDSGFHSKVSLAIYQGLVYHLLWLHSKYNKPYADPVHDPTWRWWKDKKQHKAFYFYRASNFQNVYGIQIDMDGYEKLYHVKKTGMPKYIYLDKGDEYNFTFFLFVRKTSWKSGRGGREELSRTLAPSLQPDQVIVKDKRKCFNQSISGHNLMKTAVHFKVRDREEWRKKLLLGGGNRQIPMFIGCPPGKRLAFDITLTLRHNKKTNKRYFDCVHPDPEMPCFLFSDPFHPFFLIQDMVTGESGSFTGSYVLKVIGGGTSLDKIVDYSEEEIVRYNSPNDTSESLIWIVRDKRKQSQTFRILSYNSSGIEWLCLPNSPCYDIIPKSIYSPEFYFKIMVSNRDVDTSTYCDYQLIFFLHIHGLPLSRRRAFFFVRVSLSSPFILGGCPTSVLDLLFAESFYTYTTSASSVPSVISSRISTSERGSFKRRVKKSL
uniref:Cation channel sperm associated auxiliary subunit gamma n=1 Tax=Sarcophilus harrisii TaxID=9305 RepID=G3VAT4_SARHA